MDFRLAAAIAGISISSATDGTDLSGDVSGDHPIEWQSGRDRARQFSPARVNPMTGVFKNFSRYFSPENPSSPYYPFFKPPLMMRLSSVEGAGGTLETEGGGVLEPEAGGSVGLQDAPARILFTGRLDGASFGVDVGDRYVPFSCLDLLGRLVGKTVGTELFEGVTINEAIGHLLDAAGWPADMRLLDVSTVVLPQWWADKQEAMAALVELVNTEGAAAYFYIDGEGNLVFKNRLARMTDPRSTTSQATYSVDNHNIQAFTYEPNFKDSVVAAQVEQVVRAAQALAVLWQYGSDDLVLAANQEVKLTVRGSEPFKGAITPQAFGRNEIQVITPIITLTAGTFTITWQGQTTAAIDFDASAADITAALEALSNIGAGNVICGGGPINSAAITIEFRGTLKEAPQELVTVQSSLNPATSPATIHFTRTVDGSGNFVDILHASDVLTGGNFQLQYSGGPTSNIAYNATDATIQLRLENTSVFDPGDVTVSGGSIDTDDISITYLNGPPDGPLLVNSTLVASRYKDALRVSEQQVGGGPDYTVVSGALDEISIDHDSGGSLTLLLRAGASGATVAGLQLRAQQLAVVRSQDVSYPEDLSGIEDGQVFRPTIRKEIQLADAEDLVFDAVDHYSVDRPTIGLVVIMGRDDPMVDGELSREIGDRVTVTEEETGVDADYFVEHKTYRLEPAANLLTAIYILEKAA